MVALCVEHANKADVGAFTNEQLTAFKREGGLRSDAVRGRFDWMHRELLAVVGGNFYYHCPVILEIGDRKAIWFSRDDSGSLLLNFWMPTASGDERARISDNFWMVPPDVKDLECPPSGKRIHVHYPNNDELRVEFFEIESFEDLRRRYGEIAQIVDRPDLPWPLTGVELWEKAPGTPIEFGPRESRLPGIQIRGSFMRDIGGAGVHIDLPPGVGGPAFRNQDLVLTDLVSAENSVLERMTFKDCRISGPAVLVLTGGSQLMNSNLGGPPNAILWPLPDPNTVVGAVVANGCVFEHCEFMNIAFGMPPDQIPSVLAGIQGPPQGS